MATLHHSPPGGAPRTATGGERLGRTLQAVRAGRCGAAGAEVHGSPDAKRGTSWGMISHWELSCAARGKHLSKLLFEVPCLYSGVNVEVLLCFGRGDS